MSNKVYHYKPIVKLKEYESYSDDDEPVLDFYSVNLNQWVYFYKY